VIKFLEQLITFLWLDQTLKPIVSKDCVSTWIVVLYLIKRTDQNHTRTIQNLQKSSPCVICGNLWSICSRQNPWLSMVIQGQKQLEENVTEIHWNKILPFYLTVLIAIRKIKYLKRYELLAPEKEIDIDLLLLDAAKRI
jgi:hypothetical protein